MIKGTYKTPAVNITLHGVRLNAFPLRAGIRQGNSPSPLLFIIVLEVLSAIRQEEETIGIQIGKEEITLYLQTH